METREKMTDIRFCFIQIMELRLSVNCDGQDSLNMSRMSERRKNVFLGKLFH